MHFIFYKKLKTFGYKHKIMVVYVSQGSRMSQNYWSPQEIVTHESHAPYLQIRETRSGKTIYGIIKDNITFGYVILDDASLNKQPWTIDPKRNYIKHFPIAVTQLLSMMHPHK
jgi:hypothetical protein